MPQATTHQVIEKFHFTALERRALETGIETNTAVLLVGETGVGKTTAIRILAKERGKNLIRLNLTGQTGVDEILGKYIATVDRGMVWQDGLLIHAMKTGDWIVFDEINVALPEILSALHSLLDDDRKIVLKEHDGEVVECHEEFRFFATMNPSDDYAGTKEMNKALMSRFGIILDVLPSAEEHLIVIEKTGTDQKTAAMLVKAANTLRKAKANSHISLVCSTRDLIYVATLIRGGFSKAEAFELAVINKANQDERENIRTILSAIHGEKVTLRNPDGGPDLNFTSMEELEEKFTKMHEEVKSSQDTVRQYKMLAAKHEGQARDYSSRLQTVKAANADGMDLLVKLAEGNLGLQEGKQLVSKIAFKMKEINTNSSI